MDKQPQAPRVRLKEFEPRPCDECGQTFTPTHGNQTLMPECAQARQNRHRRIQSQIPRSPNPPRPRKPLIGAVAPDFLRELPSLRAELDRVAPLGSKLTARDYRSVPLTELGCVRDRRGTE